MNCTAYMQRYTSFQPEVKFAIQWNLSKADTIGTNKIVHYREGVLWSGVYYTLCGLYLGFRKCPLQRDEGCSLRGVPQYTDTS